MKSNNTPEAGKYGWSGERTPGRAGEYDLRDTFSVGIFQWYAYMDDIRRGKVIYRVRGYCNDPQAVYDRGNLICIRLNSGSGSWQAAYMTLFDKQKSETVKGKP